MPRFMISRPSRNCSYASVLLERSALAIRCDGSSFTFRASTTAAAISSCTWKTSVSSRSYVCDQRCELSAARMSWAVTRSLLPDLRTLPSSTLATSSVFAMVATSTSFPLNEKDDVRAMTRSWGICASRLSSSSERPSEKYSCSLSELMLTSGSTAIDGVSDAFGPSRFACACRNQSTPAPR
jgi:hypothetical protein